MTLPLWNAQTLAALLAASVGRLPLDYNEGSGQIWAHTVNFISTVCHNGETTDCFTVAMMASAFAAIMANTEETIPLPPHIFAGDYLRRCKLALVEPTAPSPGRDACLALPGEPSAWWVFTGNETQDRFTALLVSHTVWHN